MPKPHKGPKPHEKPGIVRLFVGEHEESASRKPGRFVAEWVEFEGHEVAAFKDRSVKYRLYESPAHGEGAYRVYVSDETDPTRPHYSLRPYEKAGGRPRDYSRPFALEEVLSIYPMFARKLGGFPVRKIDPEG